MWMLRFVHNSRLAHSRLSSEIGTRMDMLGFQDVFGNPAHEEVLGANDFEM